MKQPLQEAYRAVVRQFVEVVHVQIAGDCPRSNDLNALFQTVVVGDEVVGGVYVQCRSSRVEEGRGGEPGVDLSGPGLLAAGPTMRAMVVPRTIL